MGAFENWSSRTKSQTLQNKAPGLPIKKYYRLTLVLQVKIVAKHKKSLKPEQESGRWPFHWRPKMYLMNCIHRAYPCSFEDLFDILFCICFLSSTIELCKKVFPIYIDIPSLLILVQLQIVCLSQRLKDSNTKGVTAKGFSSRDGDCVVRLRAISGSAGRADKPGYAAAQENTTRFHGLLFDL